MYLSIQLEPYNLVERRKSNHHYGYLRHVEPRELSLPWLSTIRPYEILEFYTSEKRKRRALALIATGIACLGRAEPQYSAFHGPSGSGEGRGGSRGQENGGLLDFDCASLRYRQRVLRTGAEAPKTLPPVFACQGTLQPSDSGEQGLFELGMTNTLKLNLLNFY